MPTTRNAQRAPLAMDVMRPWEILGAPPAPSASGPRHRLRVALLALAGVVAVAILLGAAA